MPQRLGYGRVTLGQFRAFRVFPPTLVFGGGDEDRGAMASRYATSGSSLQSREICTSLARQRHSSSLNLLGDLLENPQGNIA